MNFEKRRKSLPKRYNDMGPVFFFILIIERKKNVRPWKSKLYIKYAQLRVIILWRDVLKTIFFLDTWKLSECISNRWIRTRTFGRFCSITKKYHIGDKYLQTGLHSLARIVTVGRLKKKNFYRVAFFNT